ncbi:PAS domain S-box protein [Magnetospirillum molischianum]|uniref:histidine kinase n=1 Tax=Magnetospirillum molischianum DSM 120 TaxID=1150626 RepID=H8FW86_MAGML|nr:PAS domain S-box protein [Magnetospirillum molischianum]CCG42624.1 Putative two-component sensor histidine kinase, classical system [Magnetospirillum molischianum DSM 120]
MLRLDVGTLAFSAATLSLAACLVILVFGWARRDDRRWVAFAASTGLYGVGLILVLLRDPLTMEAALILGNFLVILSALAVHVGASVLAGRRVVWWPHAAILALFLAAEFVTIGPWDSVNGRIALVSLARVPILFHATWILLQARRADPAAGSPLIAAVLGVWSVVLLLRGVAVLTIEGPISDFTTMDGAQALYYTVSSFGNLLIAIALLRMDGEMVSAALSAQVARQTEALERRISQHDAARRVIRSQLALRNALIDTLPGPVFAKNVDGGFLTVNKAFEQALGLSRDCLVGKTSFDFNPPDLAALHVEADRDVLAGDIHQSYESPIRFADGTLHRMLFSKARFFDADGTVAGIVGAMTDITELSRVTDELRRSESDLRAILDNMTDVFYRSDLNGRISMLSRSVETVLGYSVEELLGQPTSVALIDPKLRSAILGAMLANGGSVTDYEFQMRHKDGHAVWVSASTHLFEDVPGQFSGSEGTLRLIEDRKRAEAVLQESQALIQVLINCSGDATLLIEADGTLLACNAVLADRLGTRVEFLLGSNLWNLFPSDVSAQRHIVVTTVIETGHPGRIVDRRDGRVFDNTIHPVVNSEGRVTRVAVFSRDITDQTEAEARIVRHIAEVQRSNEELEQFAYVASHDLREPLRMISSYLSLIERRHAASLDEDGRQFLDYARDGARRMDRLVLELLDYARIERGGDPIVPVSVRSSIDRAIGDLGSAIAETGARITIEESAEAPRVMGDGVQITRLFQNLIGNALKYHLPSRPPDIRISCSRQADEWRFDVADNGIGIETDYYERIFRIFQRLHPRDRYDGTGIGLAICKRIVDRHGGRIWVESVPNEGSVFSFTLPVA